MKNITGRRADFVRPAPAPASLSSAARSIAGLPLYHWRDGATAGMAGGVSVHLGFQEVEQSRCLTKLLGPGEVFFDVGANVGFYTLLGSRIVKATGRVVAFEPLPRNLAFLCRHVQLNRAENVTILPLACAEKLSTRLLFAGENNAMGQLESESGEEKSRSRPTPATLVATLSLDAAAAKLGLWPDVVKIDVEGAELKVLEGASDILTRVRPSILLSIHSGKLREDCLLHLRSRGYDLTPLNSHRHEEATEFLARPSEELLPPGNGR